MRADTRLSRMLHVLIHMSSTDQPMTSDSIAAMLGTNPVVVRRTMGHLRQQGYVSSLKGHGGGWRLTARPESITLRDIYQALGSPPLFALGIGEDGAECLVEQGVHSALAKTLHDAQELILSRFGLVTLADLARDFDRRMRRLGLEPADMALVHAH